METSVRPPKVFYSIDELPNVFEYFQSFAEGWLKVGGIDTKEAFTLWCKSNAIAFMFPYKDTVVMLDNPIIGKVVRLHLLAKKKEFFHQQELHKQLLDYLFNALRFQRIEFIVDEHAGHSIRKYLRSMNFQREGKLRRVALDHSFNPPQLRDIEVWSIIRETDKGGNV